MQTREQYEEAKMFANLFAGGDHGFGIYDPNLPNRDYDFKHYAPTIETYLAHLEGKISMGVVPITRTGLTKFGVLDIDDHKNDKTKPVIPWSKEKYQKLLNKIKYLKLPLTVAKSKSGGAHCYLFLDKFYKAADIKKILNKFEYALGYERDYLEKFPKQETLINKDGSNADGNYINLPYKGGNSRVLLDFAANELNTSDGLLYASKRVRSLKDLYTFNLLESKLKTTGRNDRTFSATSFFKKHYDDCEDRVLEYNKIFNEPPLDEKELYNTVLKSNEKKDYFGEDIEAPPTELVGYDISVYRNRTDIVKPKMIVPELLIEGSMNFEFGQKGVGKSEYIIGLMNAICRGKDFLQYEIPEAHPVVYSDVEMHPYDTIERNKPYFNKYGSDPQLNYLHILNWNDQKDRAFPDIATKVGQDLYLKYLEKVERLTGKKPLFILDNLRSSSAYQENDSDSWRPIGLWLKELSHGLNYTVIVVDHSGKSVELEMRGTSAKADHANLCLQILSEKKQGGLMRIKIKFAKARGLRPDQTDEYVAQYDFEGNWTLGTSDKEKEDTENKEKIKAILAEKKPPTQRKIADQLGIALGKVNKFIKEIKADTTSNY